MNEIADFQLLLDREGIRFFKAPEVLFLGGQNERLKLNDLPPRDLWPRIIPTLRVLDELRRRLGVPITLLSIYRNAAYNRAIGGERNSYHMRFVAADFVAAKGSPTVWRDELRRMRARGIFLGGIGTYPSFVHVDTRGYAANW